MTMSYNKVNSLITMPDGVRNKAAELNYKQAASFLSLYPKFGGLSEDENIKTIKDFLTSEINISIKNDEVV